MDRQTELREILKTMDLPSGRIDPLDFRWLLRNMVWRNVEHPKFSRAMEILKEIRKETDGDTRRTL